MNCCIISAGPGLPYIVKDAFVIAADAGIAKLVGTDIKPDLSMGDFDSLGEIPSGGNTVVFPTEKDDTDTMLAAKKALSLGYDRLYISGAIGGRLDHTFANIQTLSYIDSMGAVGYLCGDGETATVLTNGTLTFKKQSEGRISVFSLSDSSFGCTVKGLKYTADNITLSREFPLGVSNEFTGGESSISVENGSLLIVFDGTPDIISRL